MVKSLFNICLAVVSQFDLHEQLVDLPETCKQRLLEFFSSHDQLSKFNKIHSSIISASFGRNLTKLNFYLDDQLTDNILAAIAIHNRVLHEITIIFCQNITDNGIRSITIGQKWLRKLELRALKHLTSYGLTLINSDYLHTVDLSSCSQVTNDGIFHLVRYNRNISRLYLNHCKGLCDQALYDIAHYLNKKLYVLELDFLPNLIDPATTLFNLSRNCPNIQQLSLCRFFEALENRIDPISGESEEAEYRIVGTGLRDVDLYGNYFLTLPDLPSSVSKIRLSVSGDENVYNLINRLSSLPKLSELHLQLCSRDESNHHMEQANSFLQAFLPYFADKITRLHISIPRLIDTVLFQLTQCLPNLTHLALDVKYINNKMLRLFFTEKNTGGTRSFGSKLISLRLCRLQITYRALFAIARGAKSIIELEISHMPCVDDRFLSLLADNCQQLQNVNFNGCRFVSDRGMAPLARKCCLKEVRIRGTSCTDASIYLLAQFCPDLEWISHADFSGRPKFSDKALQCLRDSCVQRVIC